MVVGASANRSEERGAGGRRILALCSSADNYGLSVLNTCKRLNDLPRGNAKLTWDVVQKVRARAQTDVPQRELARTFNISQSLCSEIVSGAIWDPDSKLTTGDEMRDRLIGALDTGCRCGEMLKIQNQHVDWQHRWIRILKENSKTEVARVIPFERGSRLEEVLRRRAFSDLRRTCLAMRRPVSTSVASGRRGKRCCS